MKSANKKITTLILASVLIILSLLPGCSGESKPTIKPTINSLDGFSMDLGKGELKCDFENGTIFYEDRENEKRMWWIEIRFNDGDETNFFVTNYAEQIYPDCWDEFVNRTNELMDYDVNDLMDDAYDYGIKEVQDLGEFTLGLSNGYVCFDYDNQQISYKRYGVNEFGLRSYEYIATDHDELDESKNLMRKCCDEIVVYANEHSGKLPENDDEECLSVRVISHSGPGILKRVFIPKGSELMSESAE